MSPFRQKEKPQENEQSSNMNEIEKAEQHAKDHPDAPARTFLVQGHLRKLYCGAVVSASPEDSKKYEEWKRQEEEKEREEEKQRIERQLQETLGRARKLADEQTPPSVTKVTEELKKNVEKE